MLTPRAVLRVTRRGTAQPVVGAGERIDRVLGVGHQAEHVAGLVGNAGDVANRAVRVLARRVAEGDPSFGLESVENVIGREVAAAHVLDRDREPIARGDLGCPWRLGALGD